jgi:L-idonate 5-dehydrogenase
MVVAAPGALPVPAALTPALGVLGEPMACVVHALRRSVVARDGLDGATVGIVGAGTVGLLALAAVRRAGAAGVHVAVRHEHQRRAVERLGGVVVGEDPAELRAARPALLLVAAGHGDALLAGALSAVDAGGEVVVLGLPDAPQPVDARRAVLRELRLTFSISYGASGADGDMAAALELLAAEPEAFAPLLGERFALGDVDAAFHAAAERGRGFRVLVEP